MSNNFHNPYPGDYFVYMHTIDNVVMYIGYGKLSFKRKNASFRVHHARAFIHEGRTDKWHEMKGDKVVDVHIVGYYSSRKEAMTKELELIEIFYNLSIPIANQYTGNKVYYFDVKGDLKGSFLNFHQAAKALNVDPGTVVKICRQYKQRKATANGYTFSLTPVTPKHFYQKKYLVRSTIEGTDIRVYLTLIDAAKDMNTSSFTAISGAAHNNNRTAYGFKWRYEDYDFCVEKGLFKSPSSKKQN